MKQVSHHVGFPLDCRGASGRSEHSRSSIASRERVLAWSDCILNAGVQALLAAHAIISKKDQNTITNKMRFEQVVRFCPEITGPQRTASLRSLNSGCPVMVAAHRGGGRA